MTIAVYIDTNVFHFLIERKLDLCAELPREEFRILIPPEVLLEVELMPELKRNCAKRTIERCVHVDRLWGFRASDSLRLDPRDERLRRGLNEGRLMSQAELEAERTMPWCKLEPRKAHMEARKNEADIALAVRSSRAGAVVLSNDKGSGPIKHASERGGKVIFLRDFDDGSGRSLREFVQAKWREFTSATP